jgi:hypothetical protein
VPVLEGARDPGPAAALRRPAGHVAGLELDAPGRRPVEPGQQVDERRLAGAVRPDQADDLVPAQLELDVRQRGDALEGPGDADGPE